MDERAPAARRAVASARIDGPQRSPAAAGGTRRILSGIARRLLPLLLAGCAGASGDAGGNPGGEDAQALQRRLDAVQRELVATIGPASCSSVARCAAIPIGHKACGGPAGYLAHSTDDTDLRRLTELADEHRNVAQQLNTLRNAVSDCALVQPAPLACVAGRCQFAER